jgi:hypothetical protein
MRPIHEIAEETFLDWGKPHYTAEPYLRAMVVLEDFTTLYGFDSADDIVERFLLNAGTWRGEAARRVKKELRKGLKDFRRASQRA